MIPAVLAACLGAVSYGVASALEGRAARTAHGPAVMVQPSYLLGVCLDLVAWAASVLALQFLTVFTVQAILAGSLAVTVIAARFLLGIRLRPALLAAIAVVGLGLVVVIASTGAQAPDHPPAGFVLVSGLVFAVIAGGIVAVYRWTPAYVLAVLAGLAFSGAALAARGLTISAGLLGLLADPLLWLAIGFGAAGLVGYSRALESGAVGGVTAVLWVTEVVVPGFLGMWIFGDAPRPGWEVWKFLGLAATLSGCIWLAFEEGRRHSDRVQ